MGEQRRGNNLNTATINPNEILATHKEKIRVLIKAAIRDACHINNKLNAWDALQHPSSRAYLKEYARQNPESLHIGVIESYLTQEGSNNYMATIDLLIDILNTSTIEVGQNAIKSITSIPQKKGTKNKNITDNQLIRGNLNQIRSHLNNTINISSDQECFTPTLWTLINTENNLKRMEKELVMEEVRVASKKLELRKAKKLRNWSGVIGVSIFTLSHLAKFKYAELSYFVGLIPTGYAMLQHANVLSIKGQLTKAKA